VIDKPTRRVPRVPVTVVNVLATLRGTRPESADRVYIVSGHYDSRAGDVMDFTGPAPGANDDASGTAAVLEMARVMSKYEFDATIVFAAVAGEEQDLLGAAGLAERAKREKWRVGGMITNDIIGNTTGGNGSARRLARAPLFRGVPIVESAMQVQARQSVGGENDGPSRQLARYIKEVAERYVRAFHVTLVYRPDRFGRGGDHIPFLRQGFPAVRFTGAQRKLRAPAPGRAQSRTASSSATCPEFVDYRYVAQVARVNAAALASLAERARAAANVSISTQLEYDASLSWDANTEPDLGRLPGPRARDDRAGVAEVQGGRQRHEHDAEANFEGRLPLCGASRRSRRQRKRAGRADAEASDHTPHSITVENFVKNLDCAAREALCLRSATGNTGGRLCV
jgi:Zn-dependent M28 family amino/carboxypeptidase